MTEGVVAWRSKFTRKGEGLEQGERTFVLKPFQVQAIYRFFARRGPGWAPRRSAGAESAAMDDLIADFLTETNESIADLDIALVQLEQRPDDRETLFQIFRLIHT
ncbi:MAG TPA: hypothetical protein VHY82_01830, partial [Acetobacteraceae bacterium]|nr:hypothetical protein [Acetobacteraceae bacterium]